MSNAVASPLDGDGARLTKCISFGVSSLSAPWPLWSLRAAFPLAGIAGRVASMAKSDTLGVLFARCQPRAALPRLFLLGLGRGLLFARGTLVRLSLEQKKRFYYPRLFLGNPCCLPWTNSAVGDLPALKSPRHPACPPACAGALFHFGLWSSITSARLRSRHAYRRSNSSARPSFCE